MFSRLKSLLTSSARGTAKKDSSLDASVDSEDAGDTKVAKHLIVGLGNPGKKYSETRHNVGFLVVERLAERANVKFTPHLKWKAEVARTGELLFVKPLTFMNDSGKAVQAISSFFKVPAESCIIVYDDVALSFGQFRIRREGSAGGHNGVKSLIACLGTQEFPRLRFGVGEAGVKALSSHVLGKFSKREMVELPLLIEEAVDAVEMMRDEGLDAAMGKWNGKARPQH